MRRHSRQQPTQAGFSLVELLVSLILVALVLGGAVTMFSYTNKLSRAQLHQSDLQQSARVAQRDLLRTVRMAGRGGLEGFHVPGLDPNSGPASITPALEVRNNVQTSSQNIAIGDSDSPLVREGTDVLTVRGVLNSPPLFVNSLDPTTLDVANKEIIISSHVAQDVMQDLTALIDAVNANRPEAILIVSSLSDEIYGVAELDPANSSVPGSYVPDPDTEIQITIAYKTSGGKADAYSKLSAGGVFPDGGLAHPGWLPARDLTGVGLVAVLEEYRYYVREPDTSDTEDGAGAHPRLTRARFFPGTEIEHPTDGFISDIADNIYDLQVALGFDSSHDGGANTNGFFAFDTNNTGSDDIIIDGELDPLASGALDDWLFNDPADAAALPNPPWTPNAAVVPDPPTFPANQPRPRLYYARITTLTMAARADSGYQAPLVTSIEDNVYPQDSDDEVNNFEGRQRRRLLMATVADLRNL